MLTVVAVTVATLHCCCLSGRNSLYADFTHYFRRILRQGKAITRPHCYTCFRIQLVISLLHKHCKDLFNIPTIMNEYGPCMMLFQRQQIHYFLQVFSLQNANVNNSTFFISIMQKMSPNQESKNIVNSSSPVQPTKTLS